MIVESRCFIEESEYRVNPIFGQHFTRLTAVRSVEDVATLVEVFENTLMSVGVNQIAGVLTNEVGDYLFLIDGMDNEFDFYDFVNKAYVGDTVVNCVNAKLLFPRGKSRGMYTPIEELSEEDTPTGYLDEDSADELVTGVVNYVQYTKTGESFPITKEGTIVGRSSSLSDFVIHGNGNLSRSHCKFYKNGLELIVEDMDSSNGTYVNGKKLSTCGKSTIDVGDVIKIAGEELIVE